ncbi:MAG: sensor histidine kinase, partial [Tidjanibacter sp.]|nr:sensor histidine kinase [Tidjanibacter sp.]
MKAKLKQLMSYRNRFIVIIVCVVVGVASIVTTTLLSKQLREKEKNEVALWAYAVGRFGEMSAEDPLVNTIINNQKIPFIITDEYGNVRQSLLIPEKIINHPDLRNKKILELAERNQPIEINSWNGHRYMLFYDNSALLSSLLLFPYIQIAVIAVFAALLFISFRSTKEDQQNRVWIGMAKETAHQLGTPISSLLGWVEYLRSQEIDG